MAEQIQNSADTITETITDLKVEIQQEENVVLQQAYSQLIGSARMFYVAAKNK